MWLSLIISAMTRNQFLAGIGKNGHLGRPAVHMADKQVTVMSEKEDEILAPSLTLGASNLYPRLLDDSL